MFSIGWQPSNKPNGNIVQRRRWKLDMKEGGRRRFWYHRKTLRYGEKKCSEGKNCLFSNVKKLLSLSLIQQYVFITIRLIIHARNQKEAFDRKKSAYQQQNQTSRYLYVKLFFSDKSKCQHFFFRQNMVAANVNSQKKYFCTRINVSVQKSSTWTLRNTCHFWRL